MINRFRRLLRNSLFKIRAMLQLDRSLILQGQIRAEQILARSKLSKLSDAGFAVFAQTDEDGILSWLVDRIGDVHPSFIEFGVHDYRESNTRYLMHTRNWRGLVIDGSAENIAAIHADALPVFFDFQAVAAFITRDNICEIITNAGFKDSVGILSVDIDGIDYWVLEQIDIEADIIVVEYNDFFGDTPVTVPYKQDFYRFTASPHGIYWGASLACFRQLLEKRGYVFVGTNLLGVNGFFVHKKHANKILSLLDDVVAHRCQMREARDASRRLTYQPYRAFRDALADLPLVRVDTGETVRLGDVVAPHA